MHLKLWAYEFTIIQETFYAKFASVFIFVKFLRFYFLTI